MTARVLSEAAPAWGEVLLKAGRGLVLRGRPLRACSRGEGPSAAGVLGATQGWLGEARTPGRASALTTRPFCTQPFPGPLCRLTRSREGSSPHPSRCSSL